MPIRPFRRRRLNREAPGEVPPVPGPAEPAPPGPEGEADAVPPPPEEPPVPEEEPAAPTKEQDRQASWNQVPANVRKEIEKFHVNMGHLSQTGMIRMLRRAGAKRNTFVARLVRTR